MSNRNEEKQQRSILMIKESFQWRWISKPIIILLVGLSLLGAVTVFSLNATVGDSYREYIETLQTTQELILPTVAVSVVVIFLVGAALIVWQFIHFTHRIAGPLYRLEESLKALRDGELSLRINFREGDEFQELAERFNEATRNLDRGCSEVLDLLEDVDENNLPEDERQSLREARERLNDFDLS